MSFRTHAETNDMQSARTTRRVWGGNPNKYLTGGQMSEKRNLAHWSILALKNSGVPRLPSFPLTRRFKRALLPAIPAYLENFLVHYLQHHSKQNGRRFLEFPLYSLQHHASRKRRTMAVFFSLIPSTDRKRILPTAAAIFPFVFSYWGFSKTPNRNEKKQQIR